MKIRVGSYISATAMVVTVAVSFGATAQGRDLAGATKSPYKLVVLGTLGGTQTFAFGVNDSGSAAGESAVQGNSSFHATLWTLSSKRTIDLGTLGGPSSFGYLRDDRGLVAGASQTATADPLGEDFCGLGSGAYLCQGFVWRGNGLIALPMLPGGSNDQAGDVNDTGQVAGQSENATQDPGCSAPQMFDYEAVVWGPKEGQMETLPALTGDTVSEAYAISDSGDVVGASGSCVPPGTSSGLEHAVLWHNHKPVELRTLGGTLDNAGHGINAVGAVVGTASLRDNKTLNAVVWTNPKRAIDLGTLPGDVFSEGWGFNAEGQATGQSCSKKFKTCRGFLWQNGVMTDVNTLIAANSGYSLSSALHISDSGNIAGYGFAVATGDIVGFILVPTGQQARLGASSVQLPMPSGLRERVLRHEPS